MEQIVSQIFQSHCAVHRNGMEAFAFLNPQMLHFDPQVREICRTGRCGSYGRSWACPPAVGTLEDCRRRCQGYAQAILFTGKYELESSFDFEGMMAGHRTFKTLCDGLWEDLAQAGISGLLLSNEGCIRCKSCTYPDLPCRFPERLFPSLEGFGFNVTHLAQQTGLRYNNGSNTVTYFGAFFFDRVEPEHPI